MTVLRKAGIQPPNYTAQQPRKPRILYIVHVTTCARFFMKFNAVLHRNLYRRSCVRKY
jgi:hypothetical protein